MIADGVSENTIGSSSGTADQELSNRCCPCADVWYDGQRSGGQTTNGERKALGDAHNVRGNRLAQRGGEGLMDCITENIIMDAYRLTCKEQARKGRRDGV